MLISNAYAQAAGGATDPLQGLMGLLPIILMFVVLWFLMIRPQMKKAKEHKAMVEAIAKGDEVVTQGGIAGRISKVGENFIGLESRAERRDVGAEECGCQRPAQGHAEVAVRRAPPYGAAASVPTDSLRCPTCRSQIHEPLSALEECDRSHHGDTRSAVHAAEFLRRGSCGAGIQRQGHGQGQPSPRRQRRGRAQERRHRRPGRLRRRQQRARALQRHRHADQCQDRHREGAQSRPAGSDLCRRAEPAIQLAALAHRHTARCRCTSASTCAAACIFSCRWI